jgi:hypothetical protein
MLMFATERLPEAHHARFESVAVKQQKRRGAPQVTVAPDPSPLAIVEFLERHGRAIAVTLALFASLRIVATYTVFNHTYDEPAHIACGMEWLDKGVYRWEPQHPPLARVATALGPYLLGARCQNTPRVDLDSMTHEGLAILYYGHHYDLTLMLARLGVLPFFWVGCLVVYWWGKRYFSPSVAVVAVFLFSFLPPVLAHAGLATTDMALTAFLGAAFLSALIWVERPTLAHGALFGASTGLAILSKFSTLVFFPASVGLALAWYFATERPKLRWLLSAARKRIPSLGLAVLAACLLMWAGYRFSFGKVDFANLRLPAPELYRGIQDVMRHNAGGHPGFLLGKRSNTGFWYFYPVVLAVKTPIAFLLLLAAGVTLAFRKQERFRRAWLPLAFSAGVLLVGLFTHINIGVRHILPVYVGFSVLAAAAAIQLLELGRARKWILSVLAVLLVWLAGSSLLSHPDYLAYFNEFAGSEPENVLVDSDLDWGQDMKRLAKRLQEAGARQLTWVPLQLADFETEHGFPPIDMHMDVLNPSPGWNAVSLTVLKQRRLGLWDSYPGVTIWPDRIKPAEKVGKSILLWYFPPGPESPAR